MNAQTKELLDAALGVFLRYGYRRTTMGDIAKAAMMSRPSLYARFANKDEVYGAVFSLHIDRMLEALEQAWDGCETLSDRLDAVWAICILPVFDLLNDHPDASDIIDGADTPAGKEALDRPRSGWLQHSPGRCARSKRPLDIMAKRRNNWPVSLISTNR